MKKIAYSLLGASLFAGSAFAGVSSTANTDGYYEISDPISSDVTLDSSKQYLLTEIVYVSDATITIPAGTIIRGVQGDNSTTPLTEPGTLVITRTGQINAVGTPAQPIVFTYEADNADPIANPTEPVIADTLITGLWGGIIILGNAPTNNDQSADNALLVPGTDAIEGIVEPVPTDPTPDLRGIYGGNDPHDSSGILRYVSIRHGGFELGAANEINGLTMGGVGDGTVLEYIEVIAGDDDGFEWFGGTVNSKYLLSAYNNDDAFDYDQGFSGLGQFWAVVQADNGVDGDKGGEFDGDDQDNASPFGVPVIYNMTVIGTGAEVKSGNGGGQIDYDKHAGGSLFNSIIVESGIASLDINGTVGSPSTSSVLRLEQGLLNVRNNIWFRDVSGLTAETVSDHDAGAADQALSPAANGNAFTNPFLGGANYATLATAKRYSVGGVYLKPSPTADVTTGLEPYIGTFFDAVTYKGAFATGAAAPWTDTWTVGSVLGYFAD